MLTGKHTSYEILRNFFLHNSFQDTEHKGLYHYNLRKTGFKETVIHSEI